MRLVVQRVRRARVTVGEEVTGEIGIGLAVLVGVKVGDTAADAEWLAEKTAKLRIFEDEAGKLNRAVTEIGGGVLAVSQFTLYGDASGGNRPSFITAARPDQAEPLIEAYVARLRALGVPTATGRFRAEMLVEIHNDGPVTLILEKSPPRPLILRQIREAIMMRRFPVADGAGKGYLATPDPSGATGFGVLVVHAWWGLNRFMRHSCDRLAQNGYVAFAPDLYGGNVAHSMEEAKVLRKLLDRDQLAATLSGALLFLRAQRQVLSPRVGLLGVSMGGNFAMRLSVTQPKDIAAVIAIYGISLSKFERSEAAYQIHLAEHDRFEPAHNGARLQDRLNAARRPSELYTYPGTGHWFFEDDHPEAYNRAAAERVWTRSLRYLKKVLKAKSATAT